MRLLKMLLRNTLRVYNWIKRQIYIYLNIILFKIYDVEYQEGVKVFNRINLSIADKGSLNIGKNFTLRSGDGSNPLCRNIRAGIFINKGAKIIIGSNTGLSSPCLWSDTSITIGNNVKVGGDCIIIDTDAHNLNWKIRNGSHFDNRFPIPENETANSIPIVIEDDVLIGTRCIILKGVTIGARSIIAAGSVVTKSIPPDCIAGGNPCKVIKFI